MALSHSTHLSLRLRQTLQHLCTPGDCLIVGVSGGADSVALLHLLHTVPQFPLRLVVAHLNHCLRGADSDADEAFVQHLAEKTWGIHCEIRRVDVAAEAARSGDNLEQAGRSARYRFFEELRQQYQAAAIAVAHHQDDQAETLLLRLLRGAGTTGLGGMRIQTDQQVIRPLLEFSRAELLEYLHEQGLTYREDASNSDQSYLRNRIRHQLLPLLTDYSPAVSVQLAATAHLLQEDEELLEEYTRQTYQALAVSGSGWAAFPRTGLAELRPGLRARLYRMAIKQLQGDLRRIERKHLTQLDECLHTGNTGSSLNLPGSLIGVLTATDLVIGDERQLQLPPPHRLTITDYGCHNLGNGFSLSIEAAPAPDNWNTIPPATTYIDLQHAPFPWQVRPHQPGERMEPLGMHGHRSVQDILTDRKVPRHQRASLPLICSGEQIIWLAGVCRSRHALLHPGSTSVRIKLSGSPSLP